MPLIAKKKKKEIKKKDDIAHNQNLNKHNYITRRFFLFLVCSLQFTSSLGPLQSLVAHAT